MDRKTIINIFFVLFLTIFHGSQGTDENERQTNFADSNLIKPVRAIRTPFRNSEIMTSRGFGKRDGGDVEVEKKLNQQVNDDYRDEVNNLKQRQILLNNNQFSRMSPYFDGNGLGQVESNNFVAPAPHRVQIRDGSLKFRLNDGNLRIGRGFGKRSGDPSENFKEMQNFRRFLYNNPWLFSDDE